MSLKRIIIAVAAVALTSVGMAQSRTDSYDSAIDSAILQHILATEQLERGSGGLKEYQKRLTARPDSLEYLFFEPGVVTLYSDRSATAALDKLEEKIAQEDGKSINGYRVGIFFSNRSNGRAEALKAIELCKERFDDVSTTLVYDNPSFKVQAGYATSNEESVVLLNRLQKVFPKAYIIRENMKPKDLIIEREYIEE